MRFYTKQHKNYCGIDLHTNKMYVCIINQDGETVVHRNMKAEPQTFLRAILNHSEMVLLFRLNACSPGTGWLIFANTKTFLLSWGMLCI